uniref:Uncharacterized protein n=1 Tax=Solanum tuberosum TaxID=4113 RepID=M1DBJ8_SOLTU
MSKFFLDVSEMVVKEFHTAILIKEMGISRLMIHSQQIEEDNVKESSREAKMEKTGDVDFSHSRSDGYGRSRAWHTGTLGETKAIRRLG